MYRLFVPPQAVGANLVYFDLWNSTDSGAKIEIQSVTPTVLGSIAAVGSLAVDLYLTRTTAIGTGGTGATQDGTALNAATITCLGGSQPCPNGITARLTPSGGAAAGAVVSYRSVFTDATSASTYSNTYEMARNYVLDEVPLLVPQGTGIRVVQGSVASVGLIGFDVVFRFR